jgi:tetratricopeptide (TPR) repeat protein
LLKEIRSTRRLSCGAADAARRLVAVFVCAIHVAVLFVANGCATFGHRSRDEGVAAAREFSRQGSAAIQTGKWDEAERLLRQGLEASPDDAEVRRQLAEALWRRGATTEAMSHIAAAARLKPNDATLVVRAGEMALTAGARDAALQRAEEAIRLDPQLSEAWALRGRVFRLSKQPDRALADMHRALVFDPDDSNLLLELATMYREQGEPARCLTTLHHLHDTYSPGEEPQNALLLEGLTLMDLKRPDQASEVLLTASKRGTPDPDVFYHLAEAQSASGNYSEAIAVVHQALAIDSSHEASRALLAQLAALPVAGEPQRR